MRESSTPIIVVGASGRTGSRVAALAQSDPRVRLVARITSPRDPALASTTTASQPRASASPSPEPAPLEAANSLQNRAVLARVVVDFSTHAGTLDALSIARHTDAALVVGVTALPESTLALLKDESSRRAVLVSANMSMGVALLNEILEHAARALGPRFAWSITETHHSGKRDAPSGTALRLVDALTSGGASVDPRAIASIRTGDVVGEHALRALGPGEELTFTHEARSRDVFALGALDAACWIAHQPPGWYSMRDVLGLGAGSRT